MQGAVSALGLMRDAPLLGTGVRRGTVRPGLAAGLDEEVQAEMEQEYVRAAIADRLSLRGGPTSLKGAGGNSAASESSTLGLVPQVGALLARTLCHGLGADLVYLARTHVQTGPWCAPRTSVMVEDAHKTQNLEQSSGWSIVAHSRPSQASTRPPVLSSDMLLSLPLHATGWHNVGDHHGVPALFYRVPPMTPSSITRGPCEAELPWAVPPGRETTFRAGVMVGCGTLPEASGAATSSRATAYLLVALWCDGAHVLSGPEQAFAASLAAAAPTWLRQADGLDAHVRTLEQEQELSRELGPLPPPRAARASRASLAGSTRSRGTRAPPTIRSSRSSAGATAQHVSTSPSIMRDVPGGMGSDPDSAPSGSLANTLGGSRHGGATASLRPLGQEPDAAAVASASVFAPAVARTRREEAELGLASAQLMQSAYRRRARRWDQ